MKPLARRNKDGEIISFQLRVYIGRDHNNKQRFKTKTWIPDKKYTSEKKLLQAADRAQLNFEDSVSEERQELKSEDYTFSEFAKLFMEQYVKPQLAVKTVDGYQNVLDHLEPEFGGRGLTAIKPIEFEQYLAKQTEPGGNHRHPEKGLSTKSIKNMHTFLSSMYECAVRWGIAEENPIKKVMPPKVKAKEIPVLSYDEVLHLFKCLDEDPHPQYNLFIKMALYTGMRRGELCGLKWDCVDEQNGLITIKRALLTTNSQGTILSDPKTEKSNRVIKIPATLITELKAQRVVQLENKRVMKNDWIASSDGIDFVFTQANGMPIHPNAPYSWFTRFQERHGLKHCSLHALRHTNATLLIISGIDVKTVSGRLGHSATSTTTETYAAFIRQADAMAADALADMFSSKKVEETKKGKKEK